MKKVTYPIPLGPLPIDTIAEMMTIIEGIESGKLLHNQEVFSGGPADAPSDITCGTAHCIAGWQVAFDYAKAHRSSLTHAGKQMDKLTLFAEDRYKKLKGDENDWNASEWSYVTIKWGLTQMEQGMLFSASQSLKEIKATVKALAEGWRYFDDGSRTRSLKRLAEYEIVAPRGYVYKKESVVGQ